MNDKTKEMIETILYDLTDQVENLEEDINEPFNEISLEGILAEHVVLIVLLRRSYTMLTLAKAMYLNNAPKAGHYNIGGKDI